MLDDKKENLKSLWELLVTINNFQFQLINGFDNDAVGMSGDGQWEKWKK